MTDANASAQTSGTTAERGDFDAVLTEALPLLDANRESAYRELLLGQIGYEGYHCVVHRHGMAKDLLERKRLPLSDALRKAAPIAMDLRFACADAGRPDLLERWLAVFRAAGFTADHPKHGYPVRPSPGPCWPLLVK